MKQAKQQLLSAFSNFCLLLNLCFWLVPLTSFSLLKSFLPGRGPRAWADRGLTFCYRHAAMVNSFWMERLLGIKIEVFGKLPAHPAPLMVANHQSWLDIVVLQGIVTGKRGPMLKFLVKRELMWVPVLGWICWALKLPSLRRGKGQGAQRQDYQTIRGFTQKLGQENGGLLIFPEGTRFTAEKHRAQASPYRHLLRPKPGGLRICLDTAPPKTPVIDFTLVYEGEPHFWNGLGGATRKIEVHIHPPAQVAPEDAGAWLAARWRQKDALFPA